MPFDPFYSVSNILKPLLHPLSLRRGIRKIAYRTIGKVIAHVHCRKQEVKEYVEALKKGDYEFYKPDEKLII